jgi:hypothetical protein
MAERGRRASGARHADRPALLIGTAKGGFLLESKGGAWRLAGPFQLGSKVHDVRLDPRDGRTLLLASTGGHLGPTLFRSTDRGRKWRETKGSPKFGRASKAAKFKGTSRGKAVKINFWLEPGPAAEPGSWYCGTSPPGLFRSDDAGDTWTGVLGFNENPMWSTWTTDGDSGTPDGSLLHSVVIDRRDARRLMVGVSGGGAFESTDGGRAWTPRNVGVATDFMPPGEHLYGHDPHQIVASPADPDRLYRQDHCGFYRMDRARSFEWKRVGKNMPRDVGDIGFGVAAHPQDPDVAWTFPMDGTKLWPRTSPGARPAIHRTEDGGKTWRRFDRGLPKEHAYFTVKRQALCADDVAPATGVYFGATSGEVWGSFDRGESWTNLVAHLPHIYSVRTARFR